MKNIFKKKALNLTLMSTSLIAFPLIAASCQKETPAKANRIDTMSVKEITNNSAKVELSFLTFRKTESKEFSLLLKNNPNLFSATNVDENNKKVIFELNDLVPNTEYQIEKIFNGDKELDLSNSYFIKSFTTLNSSSDKTQNPQPNPTPQPSNPISGTNTTPTDTNSSQNIETISLKNLSVSTVSHNSANLRFTFDTLQNISNTNFNLTLSNSNGSVNFSNGILDQNNKTLDFSLQNLSENTRYNVVGLTYNNKTLDLSKLSLRSFSTLVNPQTPNQPTELTNLSISDTKYNKTNIDLTFNKNIESNSNLIIQVLDVAANTTQNYSNYDLIVSNSARFSLSNLKPQTQYEIKSITLNNENLNISSLAKTFTTPEKPVDRFIVSEISAQDTKNTSTYIRVKFSQHQLADEDVKNFKLRVSDQEYSTSVYNPSLDYVLFYLSGLTKNQEYTISSLTINDSNIPLENVSNKAFRTANNDKEEQLDAMPESAFTRTAAFSEISTRNTYYNAPQNIQPKDTSLSFTSDFQSFINSNDKHATYSKDSFDQYTKTPRVLNGTFDANYSNLSLVVEIPNSEQNLSYKLEFEETSSSNTKTTKTVNLTKNNDGKFSGSITTSNIDSIKINKLQKNGNTEISNFNKSLNTYYEVKKIGTRSSEFSFKHYKNWELQSSPGLGKKWVFDPQINKDNGLPKFFWRVQKVDGTVTDLEFKKPNTTRQIKAEIDKTEYARSIGVFYEDNGKKYEVITNTLQEPRIPNQQNSTIVARNIDINNVSVSNSTVTITFNRSLDSSKDLKVLVKGRNPLQPWSKIITISNKNGQNGTFNTSELQGNIKDYIVTHSLYDSRETVYDLNNKYMFTKPVGFESISLTDFKVIGDSDKKILYGSANFDLNNEKIQALKDKWFEFVFEVDIPKDDKAEFYGGYYVQRPSIFVPFEKINKFILSGFMERVKYSLKEVNVLEPYTRSKYINNVTLPTTDLSFVKYFNYDLYSEILNEADTGETTLISNNDLITRKLNLTTTDLRNISLSSETKNSIPYSIQNFYSLINYKYEIFYSTPRATSTPTNKPFKMVDENNQDVVLKSVVGRELLVNKRVSFNEQHTTATLTKDLSRYTNLNQLDAKDVLFNFVFEFDPTHKVLTDHGPGSSTKNIVQVPVSYKLIKEKRTIDNSVFNVVHGADNYETQNLYHKILNSMYRFKVSLEGDNLKLEIIAKDEENTKIFDFKPDHNLSLYNSAFIGNHHLYVFYRDKQGIDVKFTEKEYQNNKIAQPSEIVTYRDRSEFDDPNHSIIGVDNWDKDKLFTLYTKLQHEKGTVIRLYDTDKQKSIEDLRKRSFAFQTQGASWTILGKVKPSDDSDHRFFVTTNEHVFDGFRRTDYTSPTNPWVKRIMKDVDIKKPIQTTEQRHKTDKTYPLITTDTFKLGTINVPLEPITNFFNEQSFPTSDEYRDNQGDQPKSKDSRVADVVYAIADFSFFFDNFKEGTSDSWSYNGRNLDDNEKETIKFIHGWKNLPLLKLSTQTLGLDNYVNLNAFAAPFPLGVSNNVDSPRTATKRSREYLLGSSIKPLDTISYLGGPNGAGKFNNPAVTYDEYSIDTAGGSSGTLMLDNEGGVLGYFVSGEAADKNNIDVKGTKQMFIIDLHRSSFYGNGNTPLGHTSFYERMRLLSYYYPEWFEAKEFQNKPKFY
ncbi:DUF1410 domain-containing protein [Mycoplasma leonicaptivi]|uniref:DUF1410 domain-containing protein n=1 Tax=Mycoplasma leonicaptivi TaxID=36742 RepID=UPI00047F0F05|nr:DUF1410 domain-containing protein [Mycoplasma leonicaptivi]